MLNEDFPRAHGVKAGQEKAVWEAGAGVGPGLVHSALPQTLTHRSELCCRGREWQERGEQGEHRGGLAQGPCLRGALAQTGARALGPLATLDVGDPSWACKAEAQDLFKHLSSSHLGRRLSSQVWGGQVPGGI